MLQDSFYQKWYYTIELEKGKFTQGHKHGNLALTRLLLNSVELNHASCLDVGTQEAVIPVIMRQLGASEVVAYDRLNLSERIKAVKRSYNVDFDYLYGFQLSELPLKLQSLSKFKNKNKKFDFVNFSGVLYHMINPLGLLGLVRGLCRVGGLLLIETVVIQSQEPVMHFNIKGEVYGASSNYFIPTTNLLDYFLRMLHLEPISFVYLGNYQKPPGTFRLAVLCRSLDQVASLYPDDQWINSQWIYQDFQQEAQLDWEKLDINKEPLIVNSSNEHINKVKKGESLFESVQSAKPYGFSEQELELRLPESLSNR